MKKIAQNREGKILKMILLFALMNSSFFIAIGGSGLFRLIAILLMNVSGILLMYTFIKKRHRFIRVKVSLYFRFLFFLLVIWSLYTIFRSILESKPLITLFGHYLMGWAWLTPLAVVFGFNILNWLKLFNFAGNIIFIASILGIFCFVYPPLYNFGLLEFYAFLPILLLTFFFHKKRNKQIIIFSVAMYVLVSIAVSARANIVFMLLLLLFLFIQFLGQAELKPFYKILAIIILVTGCFILLSQFDEYYNSISSNDEVTSDTRTFLFEELFLDMSPKEQWFGRGAMGTYYSPYFDYTTQNDLEGDSETRSVNEVGYLHMIFKGGYIMMMLYLLILLPAAFLGIFRSKNIITQMCGYFILAYLILWSVSYYPVYSAEYILLWMAAGTVISYNNRTLTNRHLLVQKRNGLNFID